MPNLNISEFIRCLKILIGRRGRPKIIYSDNAKTFKAGIKVLRKVNKDKKWYPFKSRTNNLKIREIRIGGRGQF